MNRPSPHQNRLAGEKSPYLLQHAGNPVDWYPWGPAALERARNEDRPIFLSIGYSTCHWCHVMERESFEDEATAALLNSGFVCIKVDREERPDLDHLYMSAVQAMTGQGGWPMSVFLTPDQKPFFAGTYFPPEDRHGRPGFPALLARILEVWATQRTEIDAASDRIAGFLHEQAGPDGGPEESVFSPEFLAEATAELARAFDDNQGGFGGAPKFPTPHKLRFLLRRHRRTGDERLLDMVRITLDAMANGGIHDHLGGGFHRYSTDARWLVPHFEKMLYDQAGLALAYIEAHLVIGDPNHEAVAREILDCVLRDFALPGGGFLSAEDADAEGEEGKFHVWDAAEIDAVLGPDLGPRFRRGYRVTTVGNWEGRNILHTASLDPLLDPAMREARGRLLAARDRRVRPHRDDKVVTAWNGFMIEALARAGRGLDEPRYLCAAERAAAFLLRELRRDGRLLRHWREGAADVPAFLDDHAFLGLGLLALYEVTGEAPWLRESLATARAMVRLFSRPEGGFAFSGADAETLLAPVVELYDGALPSGNSAAAMLLLRLGHLAGDRALEEEGRRTLAAFSARLRQSPGAYLELASALDFAVGPILEVVLAGNPGDPALVSLRKALGARHLPDAVVVFRPAGDDGEILDLVPYLRSLPPVDGRATARVCRDYACRLPVHDAGALIRSLAGTTAP